MAEDLERDFEKEKEKARQEREEKENIYNAYQELLKRKQKGRRRNRSILVLHAVGQHIVAFGEEEFLNISTVL